MNFFEKFVYSVGDAIDITNPKALINKVPPAFDITNPKALINKVPAAFDVSNPNSEIRQLINETPFNTLDYDTSGKSGKIHIPIPYVEPQKRPYDCGPNTATRLLKNAGYNVTYDQVASIRDQETIKEDGLGIIELGTPPHRVQNVLNSLCHGKAKLKRESEISQVQQLLLEGKPVMVLVRVGSKYVGFTVPTLHWILLTGFNSSSHTFYYLDTDAEEYEITYDRFLRRAHSGYCWNWDIGPGATRVVLKKADVLTRTMLWID